MAKKKRNRQHRNHNRRLGKMFTQHPVTHVTLSTEAYMKERALVDAIHTEVGWFGVVEELDTPEGIVYHVSDIIVPEQTVSSGSVHSFGDELMMILMEYEEIAHKLRYYGHSHGYHECFTSNTDLDQIFTWRDYGMQYMISAILNRRGDAICRFDQFEPRHITGACNVSVAVEAEIEHWATEEIRKNVQMFEWDKSQKKLIKAKGFPLPELSKQYSY